MIYSTLDISNDTKKKKEGDSIISAFILYYLNIKPTHGYEIQKFLQMSGIEQWTRIQSGSIYYALTKLEKENYIRVLREERTGTRVRKIFEITDSGKEELHREMAEELDKPIMSVGSSKFVTDPMLCTLSKEEINTIVTRHIKQLEEQKEFWEKWGHIKADDNASGIAKISFQMTIDSITWQIAWHQELLEHLDDYISESKRTEAFIKSIDFKQMEENIGSTMEEQNLQYAIKLKEEIMENPEKAMVNLDKLISQLQSQIKKK